MGDYEHNDDGQGRDPFDRETGHISDGTPEPPPSWRPSEDSGSSAPSPQDTNTRSYFNANGGNPDQPTRVVALPAEDAETYAKARKLTSASQVCAIVSLFLGGVLLSTVSLVLAIMGYVKFRTLAESYAHDAGFCSAMLRAGKAAILMSALVLAVNCVTLVLFYPALMEALQSGNIYSMFGGGIGTQGGSASGSQTWG